jgi:hypothetical protein
VAEQLVYSTAVWFGQINYTTKLIIIDEYNK